MWSRSSRWYPLDTEVLQTLQSVADNLAVGIRRAAAERQLREGAAHLVSIYTAVADVIFHLAVEDAHTGSFP